NRTDIGLLAPYFRDPGPFWENWRQTRMVPIRQHRVMLLNLIRPYWLPFAKRVDFRWRLMDDWGWMPIDDGPIDFAGKPGRVESARKVFGPLLAAEAPGPVAVRALEDLLAACQAAQVPTAVVWLPEGSEFRSWYQPGCRRWAEELFTACRD